MTSRRGSSLGAIARWFAEGARNGVRSGVRNGMRKGVTGVVTMAMRGAAATRGADTRRLSSMFESRIRGEAERLGSTRGERSSGWRRRWRWALESGASTVAICMALGLTSVPAAAQTVDFLRGEAAVSSIVRNAPYSGDGETRVSLTLSDGTRIERRATARFYRDSDGRVRREQTVMGLAALNPSSDSEVVVTIVDPVAGSVYALNPSARVAWRRPMDRRLLAGAPPPPPPPPPPGPPAGIADSAPAPPPAAPAPPIEESLGARQIAGVNAIGRRTRQTIPAGQIGNDRPIDITDERWESPDLKLLVFSRHHDPRTGDVEFHLTNLTRADPPRELFTVPPDYTISDAPPPPPPPPAAPSSRPRL